MSSDTETAGSSPVAVVVQSASLVELLTTESIARSYTVWLKSSHVMPDMPSVTTTMGVRVGAGVGSGDGAGVVGAGIGIDVGAGIGIDVGALEGAGDGAVVGAGVGPAVGAGVGA